MAIGRLLFSCCIAALFVPIGNVWAQQQYPEDPHHQDQQQEDRFRPLRSQQFQRHDGVGLGVTLAEGERGLQIRNVIPESPAQRAGLRPDDEIVEINGQQVRNVRDMVNILHQFDPGQRAEIQILRNGRQQLFRARLQPRREALSQYRRDQFQSSSSPQLGQRLEGMGERLEERLEERQQRLEEREERLQQREELAEELVSSIQDFERRVEQLQQRIGRLRSMARQRTGQAAYRSGDAQPYLRRFDELGQRSSLRPQFGERLEDVGERLEERLEERQQRLEEREERLQQREELAEELVSSIQDFERRVEQLQQYIGRPRSMARSRIGQSAYRSGEGQPYSRQFDGFGQRFEEREREPQWSREWERRN